MRIAPNPVGDRSTITYDPQEEPVTLTLTDLHGNAINSWEDDGDGETTIQAGNLPGGLYLIRLRTKEGNSAFIKMVKE